MRQVKSSFYLTDTLFFLCDHLSSDALMHSVERSISKDLNEPCSPPFSFTCKTEAWEEDVVYLKYQNNFVVELKLEPRCPESWIRDCSPWQAKAESPLLTFHPLILVLPWSS